jgi:glutaredoxin 3
MARVTIYTSMLCSYCVRAKKLLKRKHIAFEEIDVSFSQGLRENMTKRANGVRTVPQIFIDDRHIGGCDELYNLERQGALDPILDD